MLVKMNMSCLFILVIPSFILFISTTICRRVGCNSLILATAMQKLVPKSLASQKIISRSILQYSIAKPPKKNGVQRNIPRLSSISTSNIHRFHQKRPRCWKGNPTSSPQPSGPFESQPNAPGEEVHCLQTMTNCPLSCVYHTCYRKQIMQIYIYTYI